MTRETLEGLQAEAKRLGPPRINRRQAVPDEVWTDGVKRVFHESVATYGDSADQVHAHVRLTLDLRENDAELLALALDGLVLREAEELSPAIAKHIRRLVAIKRGDEAAPLEWERDRNGLVWPTASAGDLYTCKAGHHVPISAPCDADGLPICARCHGATSRQHVRTGLWARLRGVFRR